MANFVGIDIGGTNVKAALVDEKGKILKKSSIETLATRKAEYVIADIAVQIKELTKGAEFAAVGIGCPGCIDSATGNVEYSNNLFWKNVPLGRLVSDAVGKPVFAANDANAAALGEVMFGAAKNYSDAVLVTLGTGVGTGFVADGKLFEGYKSAGTEGGHQVIRAGGAQCTCGRKGCWEAYASATALIRETIYEMSQNKHGRMWDECGGDLNKVDGKTAFEAAKKGDLSAKKVTDEYISNIAEGIINIINIFRCQAVILGGGVCAQGAYLTEPLQKLIDEQKYGGIKSLPAKIITAALGNDAGVLGAASLAMARAGKLL